MRINIIIIVVVAIASVGAGCRTQNSFPAETRKVLDSGDRFVLLSIDPTHPALRGESDSQPKETFHGYSVLGKTEIRDQKERAALLGALYKGIADSGGFVGLCFNPRHGISATLGDETVDLLICFECLSIQVYAKEQKTILTTASPQSTFNRALERASLPIAKE